MLTTLPIDNSCSSKTALTRRVHVIQNRVWESLANSQFCYLPAGSLDLNSINKLCDISKTSLNSPQVNSGTRLTHSTQAPRKLCLIDIVLKETERNKRWVTLTKLFSSSVFTSLMKNMNRNLRQMCKSYNFKNVTLSKFGIG